MTRHAYRLDEDEPELLLPVDTTALPSPRSDEEDLLPTEVEEEEATTDLTTPSPTIRDMLPVSNQTLSCPLCSLSRRYGLC